MNLVFCSETRFVRTSANEIYSIDGSITSNLWKRYLTKFEHIYVMARVLHDDKYNVNKKYLASAESVTFIDLPYYVGPIEFLKVRRKLQQIIKKNLNPKYVYICRVPGNIGSIVSSYLYKRNIPYGVEVVGDPWDVFAPGAVKHPFRMFFRYIGYKDLRKIVYRSIAALYVTKNKLQARYPVSKNSFTISASNVQLIEGNIPDKCKILQNKDMYKLLSIGSLEQMYKAPDIVLRALALLKERGINFKLKWLGDGFYKNEMQILANKLNLTENVVFLGNVPRLVVERELKEADLFLLVSRTEGLPRAMIEAMAFGLPCIGTNVGGIPELLDEQVLISKDDYVSLADKIEYMIEHINFTNEQAHKNFVKAKEYRESVLQINREKFYEYLISR